MVVILFAGGSRLVFLLLFELLPQSLNIFGEFVVVGSECLDTFRSFSTASSASTGNAPAGASNASTCFKTDSTFTLLIASSNATRQTKNC